MATTKKPADAVLGHGTTIEFISFGFIGNGTNFRGGRGSVEAVEVTTFDSPVPEGDRAWGGMEYEPTSIGDPGQMSLSLVWSMSQTLPPIGAMDRIRVTLPLKKGYKSSTTWSGDGFLQSVEVTSEVKGVYTADVVIQRSGVWTEAAAVRNA